MLIKLFKLLPNLSILSFIVEKNASYNKYPRSFASIVKYSNSFAEPFAMIRKRLNLPSDSLPHPSAILAGTELETRLI
jgi:hypothetical protein